MNLLTLFGRRATAPVARERLQILLSHERIAVRGGPDLVGMLREEILAVIAKHISVDPEKVMVKMDYGDSVSMLAVDIEVPNAADLQRVAVPA
jgi:cell division topological specificity factor